MPKGIGYGGTESGDQDVKLKSSVHTDVYNECQRHKKHAEKVGKQEAKRKKK